VTRTLPADDETRKSVSANTHSRPSDGRSGLSSPRAATSVRRKKPDYDSGTWIDESHRRDKLAPVRLEWERRASSLNRSIADAAPGAPELPQLQRCRSYAVARVARLTADLAPRLASCGDEGLPIACACGLVGAKKTCRQWWLCGDCRAKRTPQLGADIRRGLDAALSAAVTEWGSRGGIGMRPQLVLLTLTQAHSGDLGADQTALADGWRKLYKRMHEDHGSCPYVGVWEVTRGRDGLGHVHMHIAVVWRYRDWARIRAQWVAACPTSQYLTFIAKRKDGKASSPSSVAKYLGKYLSKGADVGGFDARLRAEVSAAFYNQRSVISSAYFWRRHEKCCAKCHERYRLIEIEPVSCFDRIAGGQVINVYGHGLEPPANAGPIPR
jgi:hypothetical protein